MNILKSSLKGEAVIRRTVGATGATETEAAGLTGAQVVTGRRENGITQGPDLGSAGTGTTAAGRNRLDDSSGRHLLPQKGVFKY